MYRLINDFARPVVDGIPREFLENYEWLAQNAAKADQPSYQKEYRRFWAMNAAQLSPDFYTTYFRALKVSISQPPQLRDVVHWLYESSARRSGDKSIQFSFATKLVHMASPRLPIYDSRIAKFYFFRVPAEQGRPQDRIDKFLEFYAFLIEEYGRVIERGLLTAAIQEFRHQFNPQHITEEKIIDSLIWAFVTLLNEGALLKKDIAYS